MTSLLISLFIHSAVILQGANSRLFHKNRQDQPIKVKYISVPKSVRQTYQYKQIRQVKQQPFFKIPPLITAEKMAPAYVDKEQVFNRDKLSTNRDASFVRPSLSKPVMVAVKRKITLPPVELEKSNNPTYISYYQIVREKIRRAAYQNYTHTETGEVYLSFVITSDGLIKAMRVVDEKSSSSPYLKETALKSMSEASPFPNFPKALDYPQLSFNVVISFEIE